MKIETYNFDFEDVSKISTINKGKNWPVVYMIHNDTDLYIGETTSVSERMKQHLVTQEKKHLKKIEIVIDDTYNKSVILDFEQKLIKCCKADGKFNNILNKNAGQSSAHNYYDKDNYKNAFNALWGELMKQNLVSNTLDVIQNKNLYKFSPYTSLTDEQNEISNQILLDILEKLSNNENGISLVNGCAGTGKTLLAISMINSLVNAVNIDEKELSQDDLETDKIQTLLKLKSYFKKRNPLKIGFVFPMTGIRKTIKNVFTNFGNGLTGEMVIGPSEVKKDNYDIIFVDESHRLSKRKSLTNYLSFDETCNFYGLDKMTSNQLDCIIKAAKYKVLFYDEDQSVKSSDITHEEYYNSLINSKEKINSYWLVSQMRCQGGIEYIEYIKNIILCKQSSFVKVHNYDFKIFDNVDTMINLIRDFDDEIGLSKIVAGYSWEWKTKNKSKKKIIDDLTYYNKLVKKGMYDILIDDNKYIWNITTEDWISRKDSKYTIGCIHTTQGFDLNYVGVIFGKEIDYNPETNKIEIDLSKFLDKKVKQATNPDLVEKYILNTYTTIMARGIKGCYVYTCNKNLNEFLKKFISKGD